MSINTFGVTATKVRAHHFAQLQSEFSSTSNPTATTVAEMISAAASELGGKLRAVGVTPSGITDTASEAYAWAAETVRMATAVRILSVMLGQEAPVTKSLRASLEERYDELADRGYLALGDSAAPSENAKGPRSHLRNHNIDVGDSADISDIPTRFRRSDPL